MGPDPAPKSAESAKSLDHLFSGSPLEHEGLAWGTPAQGLAKPYTCNMVATVTARAPARRRGPIILGTISLVLGSALVALWFVFHSIPTESQLQQMLARADTIEIFRYVADRPERWVRLIDPKDFADLPERVHYQARFWQFSTPPVDSVVVQMIAQRERFGVIEVRNDGAIHLRKAARWYRMPVAPEFEMKVRAILAEKGRDLPGEPTKPDSTPAAERFRY